MLTWISFKKANVGKHPDSERLDKTQLAQLIKDGIRRNKDIFGEVNPVEVIFSADGSIAELILSPDDVEKWQPISRFPFRAEAFDLPLSEALIKEINDFFDSFGRNK